VTLTPILPVAPAPASATDPEPSGGDGARFQRTLTEASGRYRADGAGRSGRARPADARIRGVKERPDNPCESGTDASLPAASNVANAADTGPATARAVDAALLVQTGAVTVAPVPGPPSVALPVQPGMGEPGLVRQPAGFSGRPSNALASPGSPASPDSPATPVTIPLAAATTFATVAAAPATAVTAGTVATSTASTAAATMPAKPGSPSASRDTALVPPAGPRAASTVDPPVGAASSPHPTAPTAAPVDTGTPATAAADRSAAAIAAGALAGAGGNAPLAGVRTSRAASVQGANGADSSAAPVTVDPAAGMGTVGSAHRPPDAGTAPDTPAGTAPDATSYPAAPAPGAGPATATAASPSAAAGTPAPGGPVTVPDQVLRHLESVRALRDGGHRTVLRLEPDHLGAVTVTVDVRAGAVRMAVAGGPQALAAVREGIAHLRTVLADAGLDLGDVALRADALQPTSGSSSGTAASPDGQASPNGSRPDRGSDGADGAAGGERRPARQHDQGGGPTASDSLDAVRPSAALHSPPAVGAAGDEPATTRRLDVRV
jgi:flagellar hook-length control protein FliK